MTVITERFTLNKQERLKSRKIIEQLFKEGKSFSNYPFKVLYLMNETGYSHLQTGFAVSKKIFKTAADRNRVKRLMKEGYRIAKNPFAGKLKERQKFMSVFFIYTGKELPEYNFVAEKISNALQRLEKITDENIDANI